MTEDDKKCISAMLLCLWLSRPSVNTCILKHTNEKYVVVFLLKLIIYFWDDNPWNKHLSNYRLQKNCVDFSDRLLATWKNYCKQHVVALELRKIIKRQRTRDELLVLSDLFKLIRNVQNKCLSPTWKQRLFFFFVQPQSDRFYTVHHSTLRHKITDT